MENLPNISQEELELIERFWQRQFVSAAEQTKLDERYAHDPEWWEKAEWVRLSVVAIQETALEETLDDFHQYIKQEKPVRQMRWLQWAVAASIVGIITWGVSYFLVKSPEEKLFAQHYKPDPGLPTLMGVSEHYDFENAMVSYKMGDYPKAIAGWQQLLKENPGNDTLHYFIGSAYLAKGQPESAISNLNQILSVPQSVFLSDAHWYLSLAWLRENNKDEALKALQKTDHPNKERLLKELNP